MGRSNPERPVFMLPYPQSTKALRSQTHKPFLKTQKLISLLTFNIICAIMVIYEQKLKFARNFLRICLFLRKEDIIR